VRSGPGAARTILLFHIISASPSKQPLMVRSTFGVYSVGLIFVSARTNKTHHQLITAVPITKLFARGRGILEDMWYARRRSEDCVD
jgi:hypothetical protein